jgi:hypothetical protein
MLETQGPNNHLVGDRTAVETFGYAGRQHPASDQTGARAWRVFFPHRVNDGVIAELERDQARFVVVDERTAQQTSRAGWYFSESEPGAPRRTPLEESSLSKFATDPHFALAYDNGNVRVYRFLGVRS